MKPGQLNCEEILRTHRQMANAVDWSIFFSAIADGVPGPMIMHGSMVYYFPPVA